MQDTTFTGNHAGHNGGAIAAIRGQTRISGSTFSDNTALEGGGLFLASTDHVVQGCTIANNAATDNGAG